MKSYAQVRRTLTWRGVVVRILLVSFLLFATYNPSNMSLLQWLWTSASPFSVKLFGVTTLAIVWIILLRLSLSGLRGLGVFVLFCVFFAAGALQWEYGWLVQLDRLSLVLVLQFSLVLTIAFGLIISYWVRQASGQSAVVKNPP